jgi:hypothetical protein
MTTSISLSATKDVRFAYDNGDTSFLGGGDWIYGCDTETMDEVRAFWKSSMGGDKTLFNTFIKVLRESQKYDIKF